MLGIDTENDYETTNKFEVLDTCSEGANDLRKKKRAKTKIGNILNSTNPNWKRLTMKVFELGDTNYDNLISTSEFANTIYFIYNIQPDEDDIQFLKDTIDEYCSSNKNSAGYFEVEGLKTCMTSYGKRLWYGAEEWESGKAADDATVESEE